MVRENKNGVDKEYCVINIFIGYICVHFLISLIPCSEFSVQGGSEKNNRVPIVHRKFFSGPPCS